MDGSCTINNVEDTGLNINNRGSSISLSHLYDGSLTNNVEDTGLNINNVVIEGRVSVCLIYMMEA